MSEIQEIQSKIHHFKVLLVDDDEGVLSASGDFLKKFFDTVDLAVNGREALDKIRNNGPYEVLITDLQMPIMNGLELINEVKASGLDIFIAIMSGNIEEEDKLSKYCNVYLTKPTSFQSMISMLKKIVEIKAL